MFMGRVANPLAFNNSARITSLNDTRNAKNPAIVSAGYSCGSKTLLAIVSRFAPRLSATLSWIGSMFRSAAVSTIITYGRASTVWGNTRPGIVPSR